MNDVALEIFFVIEPLGVKRNQRPLAVYSERIHGNWGVEDVPQGTLALKGPGSGGNQYGTRSRHLPLPPSSPSRPQTPSEFRHSPPRRPPSEQLFRLCSSESQ